jgi:hypothetical protein
VIGAAADKAAGGVVGTVAAPASSWATTVDDGACVIGATAAAEIAGPAGFVADDRAHAATSNAATTAAAHLVR